MLVPVYYVILYEQSFLSRGEAWRLSFQVYTYQLIASKKNKHYGIKSVMATVYNCVHHSVMPITMACSNAKG